MGIFRISAEGHERTFEMKAPTLVMGRAPECDIPLKDVKASRRHCQIERLQGGEYRLTDLESSNGTTVNGAKVNTLAIRPGDVVQIGEVRIVFVSVPQSGEVPEPTIQEPAIPRGAAVLAPPPPAHRTTHRTTHHGPAPKRVDWKGRAILATAAVVLFLVGGGLYRRYQNDCNAQEALHLATSARQAGQLPAAKDAFEAFLRDYGHTIYAVQAQDGLRQVEQALASQKKAEEAFRQANVRKTLMIERDPAAVKEAFADFVAKFPDSPLVEKARGEIALIDAQISRAADQQFADVKATADAFLKQREYALALAEWSQFASMYGAAPSVASRIERERAVINTSADADYAGVLKQVNALLAAKKYDEARALLNESLERLDGTAYAFEARLKISGIDMLAAGQTEETLDSTTLKGRSEALALAAQAESLAKQRRYRDSIREYEGILGRITSSKLKPVKDELTSRLTEVRRMGQLLDLLIQGVNQKSLESDRVELAEGIAGTMKQADDRGMDIDFKGGFTKQTWGALKAARLYELYRRLPLKADELYSLAVFSHEERLARQCAETLYEVTTKDSDRVNEVQAYVGRIRAMKIPQGGFLYFKGQWCTPDEHKFAVKDDEVDTLCSKIVKAGAYSVEKGKKEISDACAGLEAILADGAITSDVKGKLNIPERRVKAFQTKRTMVAKDLQNTQGMVGLNRLKAVKQELVKKREAAIKVIFDLKIYPDEDHGRIGQPKVDEAVAEVRKLWNKAGEYVAHLDRGIGDRIQFIQAIDEWVQKYDVPTAEGEDMSSLLAMLNKKLDLRNVGADSHDQSVIDYNKKMWEFNEKHQTQMGPEENEVLKLTNEYREMMGYKILQADDRLAKAARKHCDYMEAKGILTHDEDVPGMHSPSDRVAKEGYPGGAGENCAVGMQDAMGAFTGWYNSSGHHRNMLGEYTQLGVGKTGAYWTQDFGGDSPKSKPDLANSARGNGNK
ncbi:MAG: FHA domain-containing protein [Planctomycetes bacterium]|nr:FHA domain-containing protein [Planctomycetota bacterium]